VNIQLKIGSTL